MFRIIIPTTDCYYSFLHVGNHGISELEGTLKLFSNDSVLLLISNRWLSSCRLSETLFLLWISLMVTDVTLKYVLSCYNAQANSQVIKNNWERVFVFFYLFILQMFENSFHLLTKPFLLHSVNSSFTIFSLDILILGVYKTIDIEPDWLHALCSPLSYLPFLAGGGDVQSLKSEKAMAPHSSTLAWNIPWTEEPGRLQSMRSLRVGHDWVTSLSLFTFMHWRREWQPTPVFLPGESQGQRSLVGGHPWGHTESDSTEVT